MRDAAVNFDYRI